MAENTSSARINGLRILAVDDEPDILETIVDVLDGATVDCARSYEEATERLNSGESTPANLMVCRKCGFSAHSDAHHCPQCGSSWRSERQEAPFKYDLAILDIMGVDGMALLTQTVNQHIPTVMLTAHAMNPQTLKASIVNGALSYLPKEELANLAEHIDDVLDAVEKGQPTWKRLFTRLGKFFEKNFGSGWTSDDPEFWKYYYVDQYHDRG
jgi:CheY-like chemotaxis protein